MIKINVISYNNQRPLEARSVIFGRDRATMGRSEENFFVLPDSKHTVSRVQASVRSEGQQHTLVSMSQANPVLLNGKELEFDREVSFKPGDEIQVGPYLLQAEAHLAAVTDHPAAVATRATALVSEPVASEEQHDEESDPKTLLDAFLRGAGISETTIGTGMTPELMENIGKMLAAAIEGTFNLMSTRAMTKREVNADLTMVVVRNNNPLKFLPDSQTVLTQMLRKKMPGFMAPAEAIADAFSDLQAHQTGTMAGMHGVLDAVLERIDPHAAERGAPAAGMMGKLIPSRRPAALWEENKRHYDQLKREIQGDFQHRFGAAFVAAYESAIERAHDARDND